QLPDGFQRAEYLLAHGMIDMVVHRHKMRETLARLTRLMMHQRGASASSSVSTVVATGHVNGHGTGHNGVQVDLRRPPASGEVIDVEGVPVNDKEEPAKTARAEATKRAPSTSRPAATKPE